MSLLRILKTVDRLGRPLRDLRVSVTDRCNFRCTYCMPRAAFGAEHAFLPRAEILSFEEIERTVRVCAELGVQKVRLTGGEPLLRAQLPTLVRMLAALPGVEVALTTNGALLGRLAQPLADAGLSRVTVSLDTLDPAAFAAMSDTDVPVSAVLAGIEAARAAGIAPIKINAVVQRGVNEDSVLALARHFQGTGITLRFIEYMDVGTTNGWQGQAVLPAREIVECIDAVLPLEALAASYPGEVAQRYRYRDGSGEIGMIASVTAPFCGSCTRARLSANGHLYTCLFAQRGVDLRPILRADARGNPLRAAASCSEPRDSDALLRESIERIWGAREDRYSERRHELSGGAAKIEMSYIGG